MCAPSIQFKTNHCKVDGYGGQNQPQQNWIIENLAYCRHVRFIVPCVDKINPEQTTVTAVRVSA